MGVKAPQGSFEASGKEPFNARLKLLLRGRTVKQAAADWDVKLSTIKNYFSRPESRPRYDVLSKISCSEGVSIEWLLGDKNSDEDSYGTQLSSGPFWLARLSDMLSLLDEETLEALTKQLTLKGIETVRYLLDEDNIRLMQLDAVVKEKILGQRSNAAREAALDSEQARECGPTEGAGQRLPHGLRGKKQAG